MGRKRRKPEEIQYPDDREIVNRAIDVAGGSAALAAMLDPPVQPSNISRWGLDREIPRLRRKELLQILDNPPAAVAKHLPSGTANAGEFLEVAEQIMRLSGTEHWERFKAFLDKIAPPK